MFYLYSNPTCIEQKIHNRLAKAINFIGQCIGMFQVESAGKGCRIPRICSYFTNLTVITLSIHVVIYHVIIQYNGVNSFLIGFFGKMNRLSFWLLIVLFLSTVMLQKNAITKTFNLVFELHQLNHNVLRLSHNTHQFKSFLYKFLIKTGFDLTMSSFMLILTANDYFRHPNFPKLVFSIILPISFIIYCFIGSIYYVSLAYALILIQKSNSALKRKVDIRNVTTFCHMIGKFVRKVNKIGQLSLLLLVTHAFMGFVIQV